MHQRAGRAGDAELEDAGRGGRTGDPGLATSARDQILYLQRTVLYARHKGIVHPRGHISLVSFDNVGNIAFW